MQPALGIGLQWRSNRRRLSGEVSAFAFPLMQIDLVLALQRQPANLPGPPHFQRAGGPQGDPAGYRGEYSKPWADLHARSRAGVPSFVGLPF